MELMLQEQADVVLAYTSCAIHARMQVQHFVNTIGSTGGRLVLQDLRRSLETKSS
jgi:hypothetical protein